MPESPCRIAMGQMLVEPGAPEANLERAAAMIREAAARACRVVVLPECLDLGWTSPEAPRLAAPVPGPSSAALAEAAVRWGIWVAAGLTERAGNRLYNAAVLLSPEGEIRLHHRKINLLEGVEDLYSPGDRLGVAHTPWGTVGLDICADNFPDSLALGHSLARMGADVLLSPCAWAVDADHDNAREPYGGLWRGAYGTLAGLFEMAVVGVSNVGGIPAGPWKGRKCIGCSLAVAPGGEVAAQGPYGEHAAALVEVEMPLGRRPAMGTAIAPRLRARGHGGPL